MQSIRKPTSHSIQSIAVQESVIRKVFLVKMDGGGGSGRGASLSFTGEHPLLPFDFLEFSFVDGYYQE